MENRELFESLNRTSREEVSAQWNQAYARRLVQEQGRNLIGVISSRIKNLEGRLQPGEALTVFCDAGQERIQVTTFEFPTWNLAIMIGTDDSGNEMHRIENVQDVKLTCKIIKSPKKTGPIGFTLPQQPPENQKLPPTDRG